MDKKIETNATKPQLNSNGSSNETALEQMLKRIRRTHEFPSISKYIIEINQQLSANPYDSNASDLANVILKDYALTNKLLKLVNSAFYGLSAGKVTTVTRAVVVLGFENIRLATLSLVLFEHFKSKSNIGDLKEIVAGSFWAGTLARDLAKMMGDIDAEEAFVCAMMSQLGKLLMVYYQPKIYRNIKARVLSHGESETKAAQNVCGVNYETLGMAVAKQWSFPSKIGNSMPIMTAEDLKQKNNPADEIWALTSFVKELEQIIISGPANDPSLSIKKLLTRYKNRIKISNAQLKTLIKESLDKLEKHANAMQMGIGNSVFMKHLANFFLPGDAQISLSQTLEGDTPLSDSFQLTDLTEVTASDSPVMDKTPKDIIMAGIQEISAAMMADQDINDVALMSLEILYRALQFHRALMFARQDAGQSMSARYGYGHGVQRLIQKVRFKADGQKNLFNLSIQVGKDLIVADANDPKIKDLIPAWYRKHLDAPAFIFLPVLFKNICIGAFYADRDKNGPPISETEHHHLSMLRNQLVLAVKYR